MMSTPIKFKKDIRGVLARYSVQVSSADKGAVINRFKYEE